MGALGVFITLTMTIYIFEKHGDASVSKLNTTSLIIGLIADFTVIAGIFVSIFFPNSIPLVENLSLEGKLLILIALLAIAIIAFTMVKRKHVLLDPRFLHLSIHYSSRADSPNSPKPDRPRFVKNRDTSQAYWVSDLIESPIAQRKIQYFTYDNEDDLRSTLTNQGVKINDKEPFDEELGLWLTTNGTLVKMEARIPSELLPKLNELKQEGKLRRFQIWFIFPKRKFLLYCLSKSMSERDFPTNKRVLINRKTNQAYGAPMESVHLYAKSLIDFWTFTPWNPRDTIRRICENRDFEFNEWHYSIDELIESAEMNHSKKQK